MSDGDGLRDALTTSLGSGYCIDRELADTGTARAFEGRDERLGRSIVVKVISTELADGLSMERFSREIKLAAALQEPHIVPVYAAGSTADGLPFYVTASIRGESLRARLRNGRFSVPEAVGILRDVARALAYAHRQGVIHRDLKPENVLLSYGTAVVSDFGIAKAVAAARSRRASGETPPRGVVWPSTPAYMAPEQAAGGEVDARSDLYAWGVIAYELLSGAHPFSGNRTNQQYLTAHVHEPPVHLMLKLPDAPVALCELVMRCLEKDAARRPIAATELVRVLDDAELMNAPRLKDAEQSLAASRSSLITRIGLTALTAALAFATPMVLAKYRQSKDALATTEFARDGIPLSTLAVLPFTTVGGDGTDAYLAEALTEELAQALAHVPGVYVAGRTSSNMYRRSAVNALEVGKELNVGGLVSASVQREGNRLRVTAQFVNTNDGMVVWSEQIDRPASALLTIQDELTKRIIEEAAPKASEQTASAAARVSRGTSDAAAYQLFLRGRSLLSSPSANDLTSAADYFRQAIALDPQFARAHAYLAMTSARLPGTTPGDSSRAPAMLSARRALVLDSSSADAHLAMALALQPLMRYADAEPHLALAANGLPGDVAVMQAQAENRAALGRLPEAQEEIQRAMELDPFSSSVRQTAMGIDLAMGRFEDALTEGRRIAAADSARITPRLLSAIALTFTGRADSAAQVLDNLTRTRPREPGLRGLRVLAYAAARRWTDATRVRDDIMDRRPRSDYDVMLSSIVFGDVRRATDVLDQAGRRPLDVRTLTWSLPCDPVFVLLQKEPRFIAFADAHHMRICPGTPAWPFPPRGRRVD